MTVHISLLTIQSDNADPEIMAAISALLERAGVRGAVVLASPPGATAVPASPPAPARETKRARCPLFPPCKPCRDEEGVCLARAPRERKSPLEREVAASARLDGETRVIDGEFPEVGEPEPAAPSPASAPLRVKVGRHDKMPVADPSGRVQGVEPPPITKGSDTERIIQLVHANPGTTVQDLAREICGVCNGGTIRRIDMLVGALTMSGTLVRFNGRLYSDMKQAGALKLPPPQQRTNVGRRPGTGQAPLVKVDDAKAIYDKIVAAFTRDNETPLKELADKLFGDSVGHTYQKLQLMLRQLVASERLERLGNGGFRPVSDKERRGRADEDDEDDEEKDEDAPELESNGAPDDDALEELDLS